MALFEKKTDYVELSPLTAETAQLIYDKLSEGMSPTDVFKDTGLSFRYINQVLEETKRLENEMVSKMNGNFITGTDADDDLIHYEVTTETALKNSMESDLLDVGKVVVDVRRWSDGKPDNTPSWAAYKASFVNE